MHEIAENFDYPAAVYVNGDVQVYEHSEQLVPVLEDLYHRFCRKSPGSKNAWSVTVEPNSRSRIVAEVDLSCVGNAGQTIRRIRFRLHCRDVDRGAPRIELSSCYLFPKRPNLNEFSAFGYSDAVH